MMNEPGDNNGHGQCEPTDACCATAYCACDGGLCETNNDFLANDNLLGRGHRWVAASPPFARGGVAPAVPCRCSSMGTKKFTSDLSRRKPAVFFLC